MIIDALGAKTGEKVWDLASKEFDKDNPLWYYSAKEKVAVYNGVVYVCSPDSKVYALDWKTGDILWKYKVNGKVRSLKVFKTRPL